MLSLLHTECSLFVVMSYHQFTDENGNQFGSFELFYHYKDKFSVLPDECDYPTGWYWQACYPGCLPDGEPSGPFANEQAAIIDATDFV